jgi:hypothetical protein
VLQLVAFSATVLLPAVPVYEQCIPVSWEVLVAARVLPVCVMERV